MDREVFTRLRFIRSDDGVRLRDGRFEVERSIGVSVATFTSLGRVAPIGLEGFFVPADDRIRLYNHDGVSPS